MVAENVDVVGRVVLTLADSLPSGCSVFMYRYSTYIGLIDTLLNHRNTRASGTIILNSEETWN